MSASKLYYITDVGNGPERKTGLLAALLISSVVCGALIHFFGTIFSFLVVVALVGNIAMFLDYRLGVWLLILLVPFTGTTIFPHKLFGITGANPCNLLLVLTLFYFAVHSILRGSLDGAYGYPRLWWGYVAPLAFAAWIGSYHVDEIPPSAISHEVVLFDDVTGYLRDTFIKPITYLIVAMLIGAALRDAMKFSSAVVAICLSLYLIAAWIFFYFFSHNLSLSMLSKAKFRDVWDTGIHANDLGAIAAFVLTVMIFMLAHGKSGGWFRLLLMLTAAVASGLLLISFSRGAFVAFLVGMVIFFLKARRWGVILVAGLSLLSVLPLLPGELFERLTTGFETGGAEVMHSDKDPITAGRVAGVWVPLFAEVLKHPLFGNGLWSVAWSDAFRNGALSIESLNPHNLYLWAVLDMGFVGLGLLVLFFADLRRRFLSVAMNPSTGPLEAALFQGGAAALLGYAAFGLSGGNYVPTTSNVYLWILLGLLLGKRTSLTPVKRA